ncbi:hypothetical protein V7152_22360 [Neobacillus drentensis]|uniref:hypothetical protein n=1 Tax=Neobacillus drentensis TaxID=220684 RepID=UPI002FFD83A5
MTKKLFTEKEIQVLSKNPYVKSVRAKGITYTLLGLLSSLYKAPWNREEGSQKRLRISNLRKNKHFRIQIGEAPLSAAYTVLIMVGWFFE